MIKSYQTDKLSESNTKGPEKIGIYYIGNKHTKLIRNELELPNKCMA